MPRANNIFYVGVVTDFASLRRNKEGEVIQAALPLYVIHGTRSYGVRQIHGDAHSQDIQNKGYDTVWLFTKEPGCIEEMKKCQPYDIVECKGVIRVAPKKRKVFCPKCSEPHIYQTTETTVYPIYFHRRERLADKFDIKSFDSKDFTQEKRKEIEAAARQYLKDCLEISNTAELIGVIAKEPELYETAGDKVVMLSFPLAVMRKYRIPEDDSDSTIDFPYIKLYGSRARRQHGVLHIKNVIMVEGFVMTRNFTRKMTCEKCAEAFSVKDRVSEVIPYSIEYIRNDVNEEVFETEKALDTTYNPKLIGSEADLDLKRNGTDDEVPETIDTTTLDPEIKAALEKFTNISES